MSNAMAHALPTELTIYSLGSLHQDCLAWLKKLPKARKAAAPATWSIDASAVEEVDAAGVQLLLALSHSLQLKRRSLQLNNPSTVLIRACDGLGLSVLLNAGASP